MSEQAREAREANIENALGELEDIKGAVEFLAEVSDNGLSIKGMRSYQDVVALSMERLGNSCNRVRQGLEEALKNEGLGPRGKTTGAGLSFVVRRPFVAAVFYLAPKPLANLIRSTHPLSI